MAELLIELFSEEIPARMQQKASDDLKRLITDGLVASGLTYEGARGFSTPRRLVLCVDGLPLEQPDVKEERKGPRVGAPEQALTGFMKAAGLDKIEDAQIQKDPKKGDFYVAVIEKKGQQTSQVISDLLEKTIREFPWPKSQRWGAGTLRWVRPLQSILCVFDGETIPLTLEDVKVGNTTLGHRFMAPGELSANSFETYEDALGKAKVVLDPKRRMDTILHDARDLAFAGGMELVEDAGLLEETAGLVEWPVTLMGSFDESFLSVPPEVIITSIKKHQKCFSVKERETGKLANRFILVSNLIAGDGGKEIIAGNERVIAARLSDAKFFWDTDRKIKLEDFAAKLSEVTFHAKLGTLADKVDRFSGLAEKLADLTKANRGDVMQAAKLCKADLLSDMVGEFADLQGLMGHYYALDQGKSADIAEAISTHYAPLGPSDDVPKNKVAVCVALADKIDTLVGFWSIDEKPTGSKDPYALRRAALGVIRIILENELRIDLLDILKDHGTHFEGHDAAKTARSLFGFIGERLKVQMRDQGARHDLVDSVLGLPQQNDILMIVKRIDALGSFLETEDGQNLMTGVKRALNILKKEEERDGVSYEGRVEEPFLKEAQEKAFYDALERTSIEVSSATAQERFSEAMTALANLRGPVDEFFDNIKVNADEGPVRRNRLCLLNMLRQSASLLALFDKIEG